MRAEGTEAFRARIHQQAQSLADYFFEPLSRRSRSGSLEGKAHLATLAAPLIDKLPGANLRALMRQRLTQITGLSGEASAHAPAHRRRAVRRAFAVLWRTDLLRDRAQL